MITLGDEDETEASKFVDAIIDAEPNRLDKIFRRRLFERTRGHPLFTAELLRDMQELGALQKDDNGKWVTGPGLDWDTLPARTEGVIEERINRLDDNLQEILTVASIQGEEFTAQLILPLVDADERQLLAALTRELGKVHRLVVEEGTGRIGRNRLSHFRFRHQMFQKYFYEQLGTGERELLHEKTALALESVYEGNTDQVALQLAIHYERAGLLENAARYYLKAGRNAERVYAYQEAAALAAMGIACLDQDSAGPPESRLRLELMLLMGDAQLHSGHIRESMETYRTTAELAQKLGAPEPAARAAMGYSEPCWNYNMVDSTCVRLVSEALTLLGTSDSALRASLIAHLARISKNLKPTEEWLGMLEEAIAMARRLDDPDTLIDCARVRFSLDRDPAHIGDRLALANEMVSLAQEAKNRHMLMELLMFRTFEQLALGNLAACDWDLDTYQRLAKELADPRNLYFAATMRVS
ncbi:MAG: hypothetical protein P8Y29_10730, partial [Gemmatimonadota bacterium]